MASTMLRSSQINAIPAFQSESESLAPLLMLQILHLLAFIQPQCWFIESSMRMQGIDLRFLRLFTRWRHILYEEGMLNLLQNNEWHFKPYF